MSAMAAKKDRVQYKKKLLLVHSVGPHRNLRASVMRKSGFEVVCAGDCAEARLLWHPDVYDLVLLDGKNDTIATEELCREMKSAHPNEKVAFLVGKPEVLASKAVGNGTNGAANPSKSYQRMFQQLMSDACEALPRRYGFMEAVWRMYLVRSTRSQVFDNRPEPVIPVIPVIADKKSASSISFGDAVRQIELDAGSEDLL
jgi:CheY-like chemotaxis protein